MLEDKGMAANPGRFAGDYEEWTDWDGPRAPPFRPSAGDLYAGFSRGGRPTPRTFYSSFCTGERIFPPSCRLRATL